jgi:hypothetical protein
MAESFEFRDLAGAEFWGVDLHGAHFRSVDLTDVVMREVHLVGVDIDGFVDRVVINGVDVTAAVNAGDAWYPLRARIRAPDPEGMRTAWHALDEAWADTVARVQTLPEPTRHRSVAGEWSFVQTLRHLVFATDKWFTAPILGEGFDPIGLPNTGSVEFPWPDLDPDADPSFADALAVRTPRWVRVREYLEDVTPQALTETVEVLENGPNPVHECVHTVFEEEFAHLRYARRDLDRLEADR